MILNTFEYVVILSGLQLEQIRQPFTENLLTLFKNLQSFLHCEIACGIAPEVSLTELPETLTRLREMRESNLNSVNKPLFLQDFVPSTTSYIPPSLEVINTFLEQNRQTQLYRISKITCPNTFRPVVSPKIFFCI